MQYRPKWTIEENVITLVLLSLVSVPKISEISAYLHKQKPGEFIAARSASGIQNHVDVWKERLKTTNNRDQLDIEKILALMLDQWERKDIQGSLVEFIQSTIQCLKANQEFQDLPWTLIDLRVNGISSRVNNESDPSFESYMYTQF